MQPVVMAPKSLSTKHKNQTSPRRRENQTKDRRKTNLKEQGGKRQAAPNPGEHAIGVRLQEGRCASTLGGGEVQRVGGEGAAGDRL